MSFQFGYLKRLSLILRSQRKQFYRLPFEKKTFETLPPPYKLFFVVQDNWQAIIGIAYGEDIRLSQEYETRSRLIIG